MYLIFRDDPNTHKEVYLTRTKQNTFAQVTKPAESNLQFDTSAEGYEFGAEFNLNYWRVGWR